MQVFRQNMRKASVTMAIYQQFFSEVACNVGRSLDAQVDSDWLWQGRRVYMFDGSTVTMADTELLRRLASSSWAF